MAQTYHSNAKTNAHNRAMIQNSPLPRNQIALQFQISTHTVDKWQSRPFTVDKSSRPDVIHYALADFEKEIIRVVRTLTWWGLDDMVDCIQQAIPHAKRSTIYRTLVALGINRVPQEEKQKAKKFKEYEPGYLHIDVTYLPKINGVRYYLFVAIDRATRLILFKIYPHKTADNAQDFLKNCLEFFPFYISYILTDNGTEFTDKFVNGKGQESGNHVFDKLCTENNIEHRLTKPATPSTNGMVERVNGTIKDHTIKTTTYNNIEEMQNDLALFLTFYNFSRPHGGLRKELKVRTPFDALHYWYALSPELFKISPEMFKSIHAPKLVTW